jgi:hypothetical protein
MKEKSVKFLFHQNVSIPGNRVMNGPTLSSSLDELDRCARLFH